MPPKPKFTREEVIRAALQLVSRKGMDGLTARELGESLGSSARPIFTLFKNMEELQTEVRAAAMRRFETYGNQISGDMPLFKQIGMRMVLFGMEEPKLYQLLFMRENRKAAGFDELFGELDPTATACMPHLRSERFGCTGIVRKRLDPYLRHGGAMRHRRVPFFRGTGQFHAHHGISGHADADKTWAAPFEGTVVPVGAPPSQNRC